MTTYADSGVDIERGDQLVERIKEKVRSTYGDRVVAGVGGFAGLYKLDEERLLSVGTDGVGTKLKLALELDKHDTIGQDLVAMCVNDILCTGARPLFFLDYLATDRITPERDEDIVSGIVDACKSCSMALIGGETAEMPGVYPEGTYDLAGFAVGELERKDMFDYEKLSQGDVILGLPSSGLHSNGFSLARKLIEGQDRSLKEKFLTPTRLYPATILPILNNNPGLIKGMAHITGGGLLNIARLSNGFDYRIDDVPLNDDNMEVFEFVRKACNTSEQELYRTFNMGVGLALVTSEPEKLMSLLEGEGIFKMGQLCQGEGKVSFKGQDL